MILLERLLIRCIPEPNSGCWLWIGGVTAAGYGQLYCAGIVEYAHRLSFRLHKGLIPDGIEVCHSCDMPCCINPDHLFAGTHADNLGDASRKGRFLPNAPRGIRSGMAKLTEAQVLAIRADTRACREIGEEYGISNRQVSGIKRKETWRHL